MDPPNTAHLRVPAPRVLGACLACGSRVGGLCQALDTSVLDDVSAASQRFHLEARRSLFRAGDPAGQIFFIVAGVVKLYRLLADGRQQVVGFRFPGDMLGYAAAGSHGFDAETLAPGHFCRIERRHLDALLRRHPHMERRMLDLCLRELSATQDHLVSVGRRPAEARVAEFLLGLHAAWMKRGAPPEALPMPMTRADIGDFLGLTLETVSRSFAGFKRRRLITEPAPQTVRLLDMAALARLAEGEAEAA